MEQFQTKPSVDCKNKHDFFVGSAKFLNNTFHSVHKAFCLYENADNELFLQAFTLSGRKNGESGCQSKRVGFYFSVNSSAAVLNHAWSGVTGTATGPKWAVAGAKCPPALARCLVSTRNACLEYPGMHAHTHGTTKRERSRERLTQTHFPPSLSYGNICSFNISFLWLFNSNMLVMVLQAKEGCSSCYFNSSKVSVLARIFLPNSLCN